MFLCQDLAFFLAWVRMKTCNGSDYPGESLLRGAFSLEKFGVREQLASSHVNSESLLNPRRGLLEKTQGKWTQGMRQDSCKAHFLSKKDKECACKFTLTLNASRTFIEKHMETGRVSATHVLVEKRYGIRERLAACQMNLQSLWTQKRILPEKTQGIWGVGTARLFIEKHMSLRGWVMRGI